MTNKERQKKRKHEMMTPPSALSATSSSQADASLSVFLQETLERRKEYEKNRLQLDALKILCDLGNLQAIRKIKDIAGITEDDEE